MAPAELPLARILSPATTLPQDTLPSATNTAVSMGASTLSRPPCHSTTVLLDPLAAGVAPRETHISAGRAEPATDEHDFAEALMSEERRAWQDPSVVVSAAGVKRGSSVADLGCGPGFFTIPLAEAVGERGVVFAVDSSETMLSHLRRNLSGAGPGVAARVKVVRADVSRTTLEGGAADVVLFANVMHDLADVPSFLREVRRVMKKGGAAVDVDWRKVDNGFGPPLGLRLSESESRGHLRQAGFSEIKAFEVSPYHYGFVCRDLAKGTFRRS
ncbi:MAG: class I SAM-dependent methyltransferase [Nitrososphaerota archaeon]|nr:class I SAM-dependent methyltransferase [Nitrososphaerota archaeon]MDG7012979.1 class I SAM-dependent methyltransferase [Nitrososphaerota archaeon]MDG7026759.1 class I SAM-dependent methyltransferase [Nitrososphaerota archaeon]